VAADDGTQEGISAMQSGQMVASGAGGEDIDGGLALIEVFDRIKGVAPAASDVALNGVHVTPSDATEYAGEYLGTSPPAYNAKLLSHYYNSKATASMYIVHFPNPSTYPSS